MAVQFRMTRPMRVGTAFLKAILRAGVPMGPLRLLSHRGRRTGRLYQTPVALVESDGARWLVAAFGETDWVRNVRAAGTVQLQAGLRTRTFDAQELPAKDAAPILRRFLKKYRFVPFIPPYFSAAPQSPLADFAQDALRHAVFRISPSPRL
jgi:deazaflavin-dependent oxidoreductase (nitroreductase family)